MPLSVPTKEELAAQIQKGLRERAGITNFSESSVAGTLADTIAQIQADVYARLEEMERQNNISTAYGVYLDRLGELFGVTRLPSKAATTVGSGKAVLFSNPTDSPIVVESGTRIWSRNNYQIAFHTVSTITVPATDGSGVPGRAYADVAAAGPGDVYNVAPNTLTLHNAGSQFVSVTNVRAITNGSSVESDDNYRFRIQNAMLARQGDNEMSLRLRLIELPGVRDVVVRPLARGTGTVDVIVVPTERYTTAALLEQAQAAADEAVAIGISVIVKPPVEHPVDLDLQISVDSTLDRTLARSLVSGQVRSYIDNLPLGNPDGEGDVVVSEVIARAKYADPGIRDVNVAKIKVDNKNTNIVNLRAAQGERYYLQSIKVV